MNKIKYEYAPELDNKPAAVTVTSSPNVQILAGRLPGGGPDELYDYHEQYRKECFEGVGVHADGKIDPSINEEAKSTTSSDLESNQQEIIFKYSMTHKDGERVTFTTSQNITATYREDKEGIKVHSEGDFEGTFKTVEKLVDSFTKFMTRSIYRS